MTQRTVHRTSFALALTLALATSSMASGALAAPPEPHQNQGLSLAKKTSDDVDDANSSGGVVNLNTATEEELMRLPGIGASKARAILELRSRLRRFDKIEDVMKVRGIGRATFRRLRPMLRLEGRTTLKDSSRPKSGKRAASKETSARGR